jgi:hypothetical protein
MAGKNWEEEITCIHMFSAKRSRQSAGRRSKSAERSSQSAERSRSAERRSRFGLTERAVSAKLV